MRLLKLFLVSLSVLYLSFYIKIYFNNEIGICPHDPFACYYTGGYYESRSLFREKANILGAEMYKQHIKADGFDDLTIDVAILNKPKNQEQEKQPTLVHISGTHGVEGITGSAIQVGYLDQLIQGKMELPKDVTLIFVHALNPFGFLHNKRWNENNVDLNRNNLYEDIYVGQLKDLSGKPNGTYSDYAYMFNQDHAWDSPIDDIKYYFNVLTTLIKNRGFLEVKAAAVSGQYYNKNYLFYGGEEIQPSIRFITEFLREQIPNSEKSIFIDVHTGLGLQGKDTLMAPKSSGEIIKKIFGKNEQIDRLGEDFLVDANFSDQVVQQEKKIMKSDVGAGYEDTKGTTLNLPRNSKQTRSFCVQQEFGTIAAPLVLKALVQDNSYWGNKSNSSQKAIGAQMIKEAFFIDNKFYKNNTVRRGLILIEQAIQGLQDPTLTELFPVLD